MSCEQEKQEYDKAREELDDARLAQRSARRNYRGGAYQYWGSIIVGVGCLVAAGETAGAALFFCEAGALYGALSGEEFMDGAADSITLADKAVEKELKEWVDAWEQYCDCTGWSTGGGH